MKLNRCTDIEPSCPFVGNDAGGVELRLVVGEDDGAKNFFMRMLEFEVGGRTTFHDHEWEHEIFVLDGVGAVELESGDRLFEKGDAIFVEPWEKHRLKNTGDSVLRLICCVPNMKK